MELLLIANRYTRGDARLTEALEGFISEVVLPTYKDYLLSNESLLQDYQSFFQDHIPTELIKQLDVNSSKAWEEILDNLTYYKLDGNYLITIKRNEVYEGTDLPLYTISRAINYGTSKIAASNRLGQELQRLEQNLDRLWQDYLKEQGYAR